LDLKFNALRCIGSSPIMFRLFWSNLVATIRPERPTVNRKVDGSIPF
jgi:hypothetical protein